jgi:DnaJ-class molecular chaperone
LADNTLPGDLIVKIKILKDNNFSRNQNDLETIVPISFYESLTGFKRELKHLDGRKIPINKIGSS